MTKSCPGCEMLAPSDARFCRHCGALLQRAGTPGVSPVAATVPLSEQNTTEEIVANPTPLSPAAHTSEVTREEMNDLWHRAQAEEGANGKANQTNERLQSSAHSAQVASSANAADNFQPESAHHSASADDPEQTQITIPVRPFTVRDLSAEVAAAHAAWSKSAPQFNAAPQQVKPSPAATLPQRAASVASPAAHSTEARAFRVWLGLAGLFIIVVCGVVGALWFNSRQWGAPATVTSAPSAAEGESAPAGSDPKQLATAKLIEADALLASGNLLEATALLREAAALDPANAEPRRRLARLLLAGGARRQGIEELRAVTRLDPVDTESWRSLAATQLAEGLYADATQTYRAFSEAQPAAFAQDAVQLSYADALRLAGRAAEARPIYRRLSSSSDAEVARASRQHIEQLTPPATAIAAERNRTQPDDADAASAEANRPPESVSLPPPMPKPSAAREEVATPARPESVSPGEHYQRGASLWATNRAAAITEFRAAAEGGNADASYYLGLSLVEGRDPRDLKRADLVAALVHFGRARKSRFRAPAATYEEQLGRELDRRRSAER